MRLECNKVAELGLFTTALTRSYSDEEFSKEQDAVVATTVAYLMGDVRSNLMSAVRNGLKGVGKGVFNLAETNREVYAMSKLSRFLKMVNYMMEDAVIDMADASYGVRRLHRRAHLVPGRRRHVRRGEPRRSATRGRPRTCRSSRAS